MATSWRPSAWGRRFTRCAEWRLKVDGNHLVVDLDGRVLRVPVDAIGRVKIQAGVVWSSVYFAAPEPIRLRGIRRREARDLQAVVEAEQDRYLAELRMAQLVQAFDQASANVRDWARGFFDAAHTHLASKGWLTREFGEQWQAAKPNVNLSELVSAPELAAHREAQPGDILEALKLWSTDLETYITRWNARFLESESEAYRFFFDRVERSPLSDEQVRAVICFDNRVQVIAAAGSGKTSTMIAKAGYAAHRGIVPANRILLLAFNSVAAKELQQRIVERLEPLGLPASQIVARTFHAFGLSVIGEATGRKPSIAPWIEHTGGDIEKLARIIDELRDSDAGFRREWDLFRMVFARDTLAEDDSEPEPDGWDAAAKLAGFRTLGGQVVRSHGERMIADWLFYNGVEYEYERPYEVDTADAAHVQYRPDFFYPTISVYHEHFALDATGNAPDEFEGYLDGIEWKRRTHAEHGTALIETTTADVWSGVAFDQLEDELSARGISLDPNPERPVLGQPPIESERLIATFRSFMVHAKSNRLTEEQLLASAQASDGWRLRHRHEMFLRLYSVIRQRWEDELARHDSIDFEDMLNLAADHIESGRWESPYELVMVDEMQDASVARARLARALVNHSGRYLFTVGDDWQSINRFAGADLSVMTAFQSWFGPTTVLHLERTFRCPQPICDVSSRFVQKNPSQLRKHVVSRTPEHPPSVSAIAAKTDDHVYGVIRAHLGQLNDQIESGTVPPGRGGQATVFILGRYRHQVSLIPHETMRQWKHLDVRFSTVHASKGLEADYVVIPGLTRDGAAFPSRATDDPALRLAMPAREPFRHAEERRLFYVALTRARRAVTLLTVAGRESPFIVELVNEQHVRLRTASGGEAAVIPCPKCDDGVMVPRTGKFGRFYGCSSFPKCNATMREDEAADIVRHPA